MKRSKVIILIMALAAMSSCLVKSLHPFFKQKDKYFDTTMVGNWIDEDSCIWTILPNLTSKEFMEEEKHDSSYVFTFYEEKNIYSVLTGTLFQLNSVKYMDFTLNPDGDDFTSTMTYYHHVPIHTLARVQYNKDSILLFWYGNDWLNELFEQNRIRIKHEDVYVLYHDNHVLTADTDKLQKFIKKYANDPKTVEEIEAIFAKGSTDGHDDMGVFLKLKPYHGSLPGKTGMEGKDSEPG